MQANSAERGQCLEEEQLENKRKMFIEFLLKEFFTKIDEINSTNEDESTSQQNIVSQGVEGAVGVMRGPKVVAKAAGSIVGYAFNYLNNIKPEKMRKNLKHFLYHFNDNKENYKHNLTVAAVAIFKAFEMQFTHIFVRGHATGALEKIAYDIARRIINELIENKDFTDLTTDFVINCIKNPVKVNPVNAKFPFSNKLSVNRTVILKTDKNEEEISTSDLLIKCGITVAGSGNYQYYAREGSKTSKYGYRLLFENEFLEEIKGLKKEENKFIQYEFKQTTMDENRELAGELYRDFTDTSKSQHLSYRLREVVSNFVGRRSYLSEMNNAFNDNKKVIIIAGVPGLGKTELAKKYASQYKKKYQHILWIRAEKEESLKDDFKLIALELDVQVQKDNQEREFFMILQDIFEKLKNKCKCHEQGTLIIFDNVEDSWVIDRFISSDNLTNIHICMTSSVTEWRGKYVIPLKTLSNGDSFELIKKKLLEDFRDSNIPNIFQDMDSNGHINNIIEKIQGMPLALQQACAYILEEQMNGCDNPIEDYLTNFTCALDRRYEKDRPFPHGFKNDYEKTVFITCKLTLDKISVNKKALYIVRICSFLGPDPIEKVLLDHIVNGENKNIIKKSLRILKKYSLVEESGSSVIVHRLISKITRDLCIEENHFDVYKACIEYHLENNFYFPSDLKYVPHIFAYADAFKVSLVTYYASLNDTKQNNLLGLLVYYGACEVIKMFDLELKMGDILYNDSVKSKVTVLCLLLNYINLARRNFYSFTRAYSIPYKGSLISIACIREHHEIVEHFLDKYKIDINKLSTEGYSLLCLAAYNGDVKLCRMLYEQGADITNQENISGHRPLQLACERGHLDVLKFLIEKGEDVNFCDEKGQLLLYSAVGYWRNLKTEFHGDVVEFLLTKNVNVNWSSREARLALYAAADQGNLNVIRMLLDKGVDPNLRYQYYLPLTVAAEAGHISAMELLLERGANINGDIIRPDDVEVVRFLLSHGMNVNIRDEWGRTMLWFASGRGHLDILTILLEFKADVNVQVNSGESPLIQACKLGHIDIVQCLLSHGADVNLCDAKGHSAVFYATFRGHVDIVTLLKQHGANTSDAEEQNKASISYQSDSSADT